MLKNYSHLSDFISLFGRFVSSSFIKTIHGRFISYFDDKTYSSTMISAYPFSFYSPIEMTCFDIISKVYYIDLLTSLEGQWRSVFTINSEKPL